MARIALVFSTSSLVLGVVLLLLFLDHRQTLRLLDEGGNARIILGTMADGSPFATILSGRGDELGSLHVVEGLETRFVFRDPAGDSEIEFICRKEGPLLQTRYKGTVLWSSDD